MPQTASIRPRVGRLTATGGLLVAVLALGATGCGVSNDHTAGAVEGDAEASLPTLPPAAERLDGLYDDEGCLLLAEGERDCSASAETLDEALAGEDESDGRTLAGFTGPHFATDLSRDAALVLEDSVLASTTGSWQASGLMRNETTSPVIDPVVVATLRAEDGTVLAEAQTPAMVAPVRPGEPAPFLVTAAVDASAVAGVDWTVEDAGGAPGPGTRELQLSTYYVEPAGMREPLDLYLHRESGGGPHPYVMFGSVVDVGDVDAPAPTVVAAWLDADGRVQATAETAARDSVGDDLATLGPGEAADFLLQVDDASGERSLDAAVVMLWAMSG